ncbi:MAG: serine hydrolase domain-containing protein [Anaerolineae bacterium]|nr:serine hydrolase domain-containing protein [Anaerolineae bacterium]
MADITARLRSLLDDLVDRDLERGLQVAAYLDGELVVDAWAGTADAHTGRPVDGDTLFCVFSSSKGVTATAIHLLAERGQLDYDAPVARYWPEFGRHGKQRITVRHVLTHSAGVPHMPEGIGPADICDWDGICAAIADLSPLWDPGTATGYHALTFGWILGEVARRVDGRPFATFVAEEICRPLGIDSLYFGIPDGVEHRIAVLESAPLPDVPPPPPDAPSVQAVPLSLMPLHETFNRPDVRRAVIPAGGGIMNARSLARHYAALACGELDGVQLLPPDRIRVATTFQTADVDRVAGVPLVKGLGYFLWGPPTRAYNRPRAFGAGGAGGSLGFADPACRFAFALTKTRMTYNPPEQESAYLVTREVRLALGLPEEV